MRSAHDRPPPSARVAALRMLARRELSRTELGERLRQRGIAPEVIAHTLDDFERLGYLSDARYAEGVVAQRAGRVGKLAIARDLRRRGIPAPIAKEALGAVEARDELADATALWSRRFGRVPRDDRDQGRQLRFLIARGYSAAIAFKVLRVAGAALADDEA